LIARDFEDYYAVMLTVARSRARLEKCRGSDGVVKSPAFDSRRWGVSFVQGLRMLWVETLYL